MRTANPAVAARRARSWVQWIKAGRPRDIPVVLEEGELFACRHGHGTIYGWYFDPTRMHGSVHVDDFWDRLSAAYPVSRVETSPHCPACQESR